MELKYKFGNTEYTSETVSALSDEDLLKLRNDIAATLGFKPMAAFKTRESGVEAVMKALERVDTRERRQREVIEKKLQKEQERPPAKCAAARPVERPTRGMFRTIRKLCDHPGEGYRARRWKNYQDGMTLLDTMEGADMTHLDVMYYVKHNFMELKEPTDEQFNQGLAAWYEKHGIENPADAKRRAAEEKEKLAEQRKAEAEAAAKARDEVAAAKPAEPKKNGKKAAKTEEVVAEQSAA